MESMLLTFEILRYVRTGDYFSYNPTSFANICILMLFILYTYALTIGGWKKWEQYMLVPLPIATGIFMVMVNVNFTYAILIAIISFLLISYDVTIVTNIKNNMIKFNPVVVLRYSTKGILFVFSVLSFVLVVLNSAGNQNIDISGKIAEVANKQFKNYFESKMKQQQLSLDMLQNLTGTNLPIDLSQIQLPESSESATIPGINLDLEDTVRTEVDNIIAPYRHFIPSIIALIVYALVRFLGVLANLIFDLTAWFIFAGARKLNFIHNNFVQVKKEEISFNKDPNSDSVENPE